MGVHVSTGQAVLRLLIAFGLTYAIGFERELRGSSAGNRTFSLVGLVGAISGLFAVSFNAATAFSGVLTGVGFVGAAVTAHIAGRDGGLVRGLTTATSILAAAAIGGACGAGLKTEAAFVAALVLLSLELRWIPVFKYLDANVWAGRVRSENKVGGLATLPGNESPDTAT